MELTYVHKLMLDILTNSVKPIERRQISRQLGVTDDVMRQLKRDLINEGYAIGSHHKHGYFIIRTDADLELALDEMRRKARTMSIRANKIHQNYAMSVGRKINKQLNLFV